jgi:putative endonuclease
MYYKKALGNFGENLAAKYYLRRGYKIVARNYWTLYGEIDLVVQKEKHIFLIEVKTRRGSRYGWAEETISQKKIQNIVRSYSVLQKAEHLPIHAEVIIFVVELAGRKAIIKTIEI